MAGARQVIRALMSQGVYLYANNGKIVIPADASTPVKECIRRNYKALLRHLTRPQICMRPGCRGAGAPAAVTRETTKRNDGVDEIAMCEYVLCDECQLLEHSSKHGSGERRAVSG